MLTLRRLDLTGFRELLDQWTPLFNGDADLLYEHCRPHLEHAERICGEDPPDLQYGIYALIRHTDGTIVYEGFTHVNHKLPNSPDAEVRMVWNTLSPRYETALTPEILADFTVAYISGAIDLAKNSLPANAVRVYLGNATDRQYAQGIMAVMQSRTDVDVAFAGNWLHINGVTTLEL